jgi:hypothetical protein
MSEISMSLLAAEGTEQMPLISYQVIDTITAAAFVHAY